MLRSDPTKNIIVVGFPRSGNTFTARLLADALNCPTTGHLSAVPLATEGLDRPGEYVVLQLHLSPTDHVSPDFVATATTCNIDSWKGEKVVFVSRDPRDVAVSAWKYWGLENLPQTIIAMAEGTKPFIPFGSWIDFNMRWLNVNKRGVPASIVFYRHIVQAPASWLYRNMKAMKLENVNDLNEVAHRQFFGNKKKEIESEQDDVRPYGKAIQLKHLRKGIPGDWKNHFCRKEAELFHSRFGSSLVDLGFETDVDWWKNVK